MATIRHQAVIDAPVAKVYEAIATAEKIGTWWDKQTPTQTDRGLVLEHNPGPEHGVVKLRVVEQVPNKRVEWECISTHPKRAPLPPGRARTLFSKSFPSTQSTPRWIFPNPAMMNGVNFLASTTPLGRRYCRT